MASQLQEPVLTGLSWIGAQRGAPGRATFHAIDPVTDNLLQPCFYTAHESEVDEAVALATTAFASYRHLPGTERSAFLRTIAANMEALRPVLIERAQQETGLPKQRLETETDRTCEQLRDFANIAKDGSWIEARINPGDSTRLPTPRPDVRSMLVPLGPVAVFAPANFPLAYSVAGGDSASALAAGCPVIVKAHPAHPGVSELAANAIREALHTHHLPQGVFSLLFDNAFPIAQKLVAAPGIQAVGFTGSQEGGIALASLAQNRPQPIPFFGELGSLNPVFLLPEAARHPQPHATDDLYQSMTLCGGQYCTHPGRLIASHHNDTSAFLSLLAQRISETPAVVMLHSGVASRYRENIQKLATRPGVRALAQGKKAEKNQAQAILLECAACDYLRDPVLQELEAFGPGTVIVRAAHEADYLTIADNLRGNLTAAIHTAEQDKPLARKLLSILEQKAGRVIINGQTTTLERCDALVHGGPFPATTDSRFTAVSGAAIRRWARPVCYQDCPPDMLPEALQTAH